MKFVSSKNLDLCAGTSKIINIADSFSGEEETKIRGQLLTLFGEPVYNTQNLEDAYSYVVLAADENEKQCILHVYCGSTGSAIGGDNNIQGIYDIAEKLKHYIKQANTTDFEYESYYIDGPAKIYQKIENGNIIFSEMEIEGEELDKAMKICYPS
jgi:hypothetical protein